MMMDIAVYKMKKGDVKTFLSSTEETAVLVVLGKVSFAWNGHKEEGFRQSGTKVISGGCP